MKNPKEVNEIRKAMKEFLADRLESKLGKPNAEEKRRELERAHQPATWIADAARRVGQIQLVTHAAKYSHPDARGTSLYSNGNQAAGEHLVGTHSLGGGGEPDVVGNAAALDVFKFLSIEVNGQPLWLRASKGDPSLLAALPGDDGENHEWMESFASISTAGREPASHSLAKQIYWPIPKRGYHLLQPLFPTTLAHRVRQVLEADRFSEESKEARQARRANKFCSHGYRDWPHLTVQTFGGSKPQNISQLNSERHGEVWLIASVPPNWDSRAVALPLGTDSVFQRFGRKRELRRQIRRLGRYLQSVKDWNNQSIRQGRAIRVEAIMDELLQYAASVRDFDEPGWTSKADCLLPEAEQFWLDPRRDDPEFLADRESSDWPRLVSESFGAWLNAELHRFRLPVGDDEFRVWRKEFEGLLEEALREMEA